MSRALDAWERSEANSRPAVTPYKTLMIQAMHAGSGRFAHIYQGAVVLCVSIICAQILPLNAGGACGNLREGFIPPRNVLEATTTRLRRLWTPLWVRYAIDFHCTRTPLPLRLFLSAVCSSFAFFVVNVRALSLFVCAEIVRWNYAKGTWCLQIQMRASCRAQSASQCVPGRG